MSAEFENNILIVRNPVDDSELSRFTVTDEPTFNSITSKVSSYSKWSELSLKKRCYHISRLRKAIVANQDELEKTLKSETGKKDFDVFIEVFTVLEHLKQMPKIAKKALKPSYRNAGIMKSKKAYVLYEPLGVCGVISPWNYPLATPITSAVEALLAGNSVVLKPSEHTPLSVLYIKELWNKYICYNNAFNIVVGDSKVGKMLVSSDKIDMICFTGSTKVGKTIAKTCAETLKPLILELGGKDPLIVLRDADLKRAVESSLFAGFSNAGQTCISVEDVFVEETIFNQYLDIMIRRVKSMSSGNEDVMEIGSMIMEPNCNKVKEYIDDIADKNKIITGHSIDHKMYIAPTLVVNPPDDSKLVNQETFGPVICIRSFSTQDELLKMVHKTGYGLAGSIFGRNKKRIKKLLRELKIGNVSINDVFTHYGIASLPFGGEGLSGVGRLHGYEGLRALSRSKSVLENRFRFLPDPWWYGHSKGVERILNFFLKYYYRI